MLGLVLIIFVIWIACGVDDAKKTAKYARYKNKWRGN